MDRILEAELAVEQKSDQGVEGPGGTGGSGSSVSDGINPFSFVMGGCRGGSLGLFFLPLPFPSRCSSHCLGLAMLPNKASQNISGGCVSSLHLHSHCRTICR